MKQALGQAGLPRGLIGRILGRIMLKHNAPDNQWTLSLLNINPGEQVLEIGFGPGAAIESLVRQDASVQVTGVDHSEAMLAQASARNRQAIAAGNVKLQQGSVDTLAFDDASFDKAYSINCIYFWADPVQGLKELYRVLKPGGQLAITVRDKQRDSYLPFRPDKLAQRFQQAGFHAVDVKANGVPAHPLFCVLGLK